jgi:hypothetical protein
MAVRTKAAQASAFTTIEIENTETIAMDLHVSMPGGGPDGEEFFIVRLEPGDKTVQFSPVGAVWSLRPEVATKQFIAQANAQTGQPPAPPKKSTRKGRGGHAITTDVAQPTGKPTGGTTSG